MDLTNAGFSWSMSNSSKRSTLMGVMIWNRDGLEQMVSTAAWFSYSSAGTDGTGSAVRDHCTVELRTSSLSSQRRPRV